MTVASVFAVLLLGGVVGFVGALTQEAVKERLASNALLVMATIAVLATLGSLYFSEIEGFIPCEFCWYQRIAMYPLGAILPIAAVRRDRNVLPYVLVLATIGLGLSIYHIQLQLFPEQSTSCDLTSPCTARWVEGLGFMTIPQMAGTSFALIIGLGVLSVQHHRGQRSVSADAPPQLQHRSSWR